MNKKDLIETLAIKKDLTKKEAESMVNTVFGIMTDSLLDDDKVVISGFGTFNVHNRKERKGISPNTHTEMVIPASKSVIFKPSNVFKDKMNEDH
jgi:nucleoid DNA-binding protein